MQVSCLACLLFESFWVVFFFILLGSDSWVVGSVGDRGLWGYGVMGLWGYGVMGLWYMQLSGEARLRIRVFGVMGLRFFTSSCKSNAIYFVTCAGYPAALIGDRMLDCKEHSV